MSSLPTFCYPLAMLQVIIPEAPCQVIALAVRGPLKGQKFSPLPLGATVVCSR